MEDIIDVNVMFSVYSAGITLMDCDLRVDDRFRLGPLSFCRLRCLRT
jgi:hypothetical protein